MLCGAVQGQLAQDPPQEAGELVAVPRTHRHQDGRMLWQGPQDEVPIRRQGVEAGLGGQLRPQEAGDVGRQPLVQDPLPHRIRLEGAGLRRHRRAGRIDARLGGHLPVDREAVDVFLLFPDEDGEALGRELLQVGRGVVGDLLLGHGEGQGTPHRSQELLGPGPRGDHQPLGPEGSPGRLHLDAVRARVDGLYWALLQNGGAPSSGQDLVHGHALARVHQAGLGLVEGHHLLVRLELGEAVGQLVVVQPLVGHPGRVHGPGVVLHILPEGPLGMGDLHAAAAQHQGHVRLFLDGFPGGVAVGGQPGVLGIVVHEADDPGMVLGAAPVVVQAELLQPQDVPAQAPGKPVEGSAADAAAAQHDGGEFGSHGGSSLWKLGVGSWKLGIGSWGV